MKVTALVMAGGKGSRMNLSEEKPLLCLDGKPLIDYVLDALKESSRIEEIVVTVSNYTPKTRSYLESKDVNTIKTPGKEYVFDMGYAVKKLNLETVLAIAADLPLITGEIIDNVIEYYTRSGKPALAVAVPLETRRKLCLGTGYRFELNGKEVAYAGINVNDGRRIHEEELDQEILVLDRVEVALNINTVDELTIAEEYLA